MWCRNKNRIYFHSELSSQERYDLMKNIYDRWDMMTYPVPEIYYKFCRETNKRTMPSEIRYTE